jgi:hypothetical protein
MKQRLGPNSNGLGTENFSVGAPYIACGDMEQRENNNVWSLTNYRVSPGQNKLLVGKFNRHLIPINDMI